MYAYCENDPINHSDPTGYCAFDNVSGVAGQNMRASRGCIRLGPDNLQATPIQIRVNGGDSPRVAAEEIANPNGATVGGLISGGKNAIFVVNTRDEANAFTNLRPGDVIIIDGRRDNNPNITIMNSFQTTYTGQVFDIIDALILYNQSSPVTNAQGATWNRTRYGMYVEWKCHNGAVLYDVEFHNFNIRGRDVDLDNGASWYDEGINAAVNFINALW
jgi:hypothetical protein